MKQKSGNTDRHFKGQLETERVECFFRKHWIVLTKDLLGFIMFLGVLAFTAFHFSSIYNFFSQDSLVITVLAFIIIGVFTVYIHKFFLRFIRYFLDIVILTNYRIVILDKSLFLHNTKEALDLNQIQNIEKEQVGILQNMLKYGNIMIILAASSAVKKIYFVPNADFHFRKINKLKRAYIKEKYKTERTERQNLNAPFMNKSRLSEETYSGLS